MAIPNETIEIAHVGDKPKESFRAGMRAEDFPHLANLLINLYSRPVEAVLREYSTNALDSHIDAGVTRPIEVTLPTSARPELKIQDFGLGLSVDDLRDIYSMYGRSTKRDSNAATGQLGLGCKSGLTYCDTFGITSVRNGVKIAAESTKDEHGIGVINIIDTKATDEPNGVTITIPVGAFDIGQFERAAEHLFQFWDEGTVLVNGEAPEIPDWRKRSLVLDDENSLFIVPTDSNLDSSYVVMGNVAYDARDAYVEHANGGRSYRRFVYFANHGDVDFPPSRETLHMTPHTKETLSELRDYISERFDVHLEAALDECSTHWERSLLTVQWKGSSRMLNATQDKPVWVYTPSTWERSKAKAHISYRYSYLTSDKVFIVTDFPNKGLAASHRDRLHDYAPGFDRYVVVPDTCDTTGLRGRDNCVDWDTILGETESTAPASNGTRAKRGETKYTVLDGDPMTADELAEIDGTVLFLEPKEGTPYGDLGADTIVRMYSTAQEDRLRRLVPGIKHYSTAVREARRKAELAVTDEMRYHATVLNKMRSPFTKIDPADVDDPELAEVIRLSGVALCDAAVIANKFGVELRSDAAEDKLDEIFERYPLVEAAHRHYFSHLTADTVFYINAKYASLLDSMTDDEVE